MTIIDRLASIPYRIFGVLLVLLCAIIGIPAIAIPTILSLISQGMTYKEAQRIGEMLTGDCTLKDILDILNENGGWMRVVSKILSKMFLGICMIFAGIYYEEAYYEGINHK